MKNPAEIAAAVRTGYSTVCATCDRLHPDPQRPEIRVCNERTCGGPFSGRDFPRYKGPITDFSRWCFVCGEPSKYGVQAPETARRFGLCQEHVAMMRDTVPTIGDLRPVAREVMDPRRGLVTLDQLLGRPQKTLGQAIGEAEAHFADKDSQS